MFQINLGKFNNQKLLECLKQKRLPTSAYDKAGKISKMTQPTSIKQIDPDNIRGWFLQSVLQLNTVNGLPIAILFKRPSKNDPQFEKVLRKSLDEDDQPTEATKELGEKFNKAKATWDMSENNVKAFLLTAAGKDASLQRLMTDTKLTSFEIFRQLLVDFDKTSPDMAIALRKKLFGIELKCTMTLAEFLSGIESIIADINAAGGNVDMSEAAQLALGNAKFDKRFESAVAAHIAALEKDHQRAEWIATKSYLLQLDRSTPAPGSETSKEKIMMTTTDKPMCKRCGVPHPYGKHTKRSGGRTKKSGGRGGGPRNRRERDDSEDKNEDLREAVKSLTAALTEATGKGFSRDRSYSRNIDRTSRYCTFCHKSGHTEEKCFSNPKSSEYKGPRKRFQESNSRAFLTDGDKDDSRREYYDALARNNRRKFDEGYDAFVLWLKPETFGSSIPIALSTSLSEDRNPYIFILDTAATRIFVWSSQHTLLNSRLVSHNVQTAGAGSLKTVREGVLGTVGVMGMSDELQRQLLGTEVLCGFHGYRITLNGLGAFIFNPESTLTGRPVGPFLAKYKDGLIQVDIRNIPEFWIQESIRNFRPVKYDEALVHSEEPNRRVPMTEAWPSVVAELGPA